MTDIPRSTLSDALSPRRTRLPSLDLVLRYVRACGCSEDEAAEWASAWRAIQAARTESSRPAEHEIDVVPRQLPAAIRHFVGRESELKALDELVGGLRGGTTVVITAIAGTAGIGKTATAVYWAHQVADQFPDGQLYADLRGFDPNAEPVRPGEVIRQFLDAFGVPPERIPASQEGQAALYRSLLANRRMLVVLDNAADVEQVRPLLPGGPNCLVLVTSRNQLAGLVAQHGAHPITLGLLADTDAYHLLSRYVGAEPIVAEPEAVATLIERCAGLPLALAIAGARAAVHPTRPLANLAGEFASSQERLDVLDTGHPATDVRAVFSASYRALSERARGMFRLLGSHPGFDISTSAAASLAGVPVRQVRPLLSELATLHLIVEHAPGRFTFHDLLRAYARELVHTHEPKAARLAQHRLLDHYLHTAHTAARLLQPHREPLTLTPARPGVSTEELADRGQALAWFDTEYRVLRTAIGYAAENGFDTHAWQLVWTLANFMDVREHWRDLDARTIHEIALRAAERAGDRAGQAHAHAGMAVAHTRHGRSDDAERHLRHALDLFDELDDDTGRAYTHFILSWVMEVRGDHDAALHHNEQALALFRTTGNQAMEGQALNGIGWTHAQIGNHRQALSYCRAALDLVQTIGDRNGEAATWDSLAYTHRQLGNLQQAITCYENAIDLLHELKRRYLEAETLRRFAETQHTAGHHRAARATLRQALGILDELGDPTADQVRADLDSGTPTVPA